MDKRSLLTQLDRKWTIGLTVAGMMVVGATVVYGTKTLRQLPASTTAELTVPELPKIEAVTALGRIEPLGEVIQIAPSPSSTTGGAKVEQLLVEESDRVYIGQKLAQLDSYGRLKAALDRAKEDVEVAKTNLELVKAGAKQGEIDAQRATIERLKAQLQGEIDVQRATIERLNAQLQGDRNAQQATVDRLDAELRNAITEFNRHEQLYQDGAISESERDSRSLTQATTRERLAEAKANKIRTEATLAQQIREAQANKIRTETTLTQQIREAQATLDRIAEVRPEEVRQAQAQVNLAQASVRQAQEDLDLAEVRSPINGQVLEINTRVGEVTNIEDGIMAIGKTDRMVVVAEVYESDISRVRLGLDAVITSENGSFEGEIRGEVSNIGLQIGKRDVLDTDPAADVDARVVEVDILLNSEDSQKVSSLTNAKVYVEIVL